MRVHFATRGTPIRGQVSFLAVACLVVLTGCFGSAPDDVIVQPESTEALIFVKTYGEETLNRSWASGNLYMLSPISPDGTVTPITNYQGASISDPVVSFEGDKIMFSMRPPGGGNRNIYEINADGTNLRQITDGGGHDFDPLYLPDGKILFTSSRAGEMDEYNHSPAETIYSCDPLTGTIERCSFNQSDDFDPALMPNGRIIYTRWEHFGTFNRFPLFEANPDGTGLFHFFGPHNRNFFHPQPMPDGRVIAIESTMINEDAGPIAVLQLENGPADPAPNGSHWSVLTANVNTDGAPWPYGAFKYPTSIGENLYVASYTLPAAEEGQVDYGLYTFSLEETGAGTEEDPTELNIVDLTFLYNDPNMNEYDAQLLAARERPPVIESEVDHGVDWGIFTAQDVFNRGSNDGQERPAKGIDSIDRIAVIAARPTRAGDPRDFSANDFEKRAFLGYAPVQPDGSFSIRVPADTPITFATLDDDDRGFVVKRTWLAVRPGEHFSSCTGCHEDRAEGEGAPTNPNPMALSMEPTDLNMDESEFRIINYINDIEPIVANNCRTCHTPGDGGDIGINDPPAAPAAGGLDLSYVMEEGGEMMAEFPRSYLNLSGEGMNMEDQVVVPAFPRRSLLIDYIMGVGSREGMPRHPENAPYRLTNAEIETLNLWVLMGAQYR